MEQWEADQNGNQLNPYNMIFRPLLLTVAYRFSGHVHVEVGAVQGIAGGDLLQEGGVLLQVGPNHPAHREDNLPGCELLSILHALSMDAGSHPLPGGEGQIIEIAALKIARSLVAVGNTLGKYCEGIQLQQLRDTLCPGNLWPGRTARLARSSGVNLCIAVIRGRAEAEAAAPVPRDTR